MRILGLSGMLSALLLALLFTTGCVKTQDEKDAITPWPDPETTAANAIELYDTNHNGKIDGAEFDATPALKYACVYMDRNGDKMLDQQEIATQIQLWIEYGIKYSEISVTFTENGQPLTDTEATFTPEPFLGPSYTVATSNVQSGNCLPKSEGAPEEAHGIRTGFYTITFDKYPGEKWGIEISHYNEIALQNRGNYELELRKQSTKAE